MSDLSDATRIAREFHAHYERLASRFGYATRPESAVPWDDVPHANRDLMVAVVEALIDQGTVMPGTRQRDRLAQLLLQVHGAVQTEQAYEDWWHDVVDELVAQGIAIPQGDHRMDRQVMAQGEHANCVVCGEIWPCATARGEIDD